MFTLRKIIHCFFLLIMTDFAAHAQDYPKNYFSAPLDTPLILTGTFGEIRDNHFHSGLDLSTGEQEGLPVMAAADGYVSRIKISADGYGKAIYITHPNGYVTVYGHLQKYAGDVYNYARKIQYERQSFEIDANLKKNEFKVTRHQIIGYSGSTGGAISPHLHFEVRDEVTEEPINPLLFGLPYHDTIPPQLRAIRIYPVRENGIVNRTDSAMTYEVQPAGGGINILNSLALPLAYGTIGFGFSAFDTQNNSTAELGIYSAELSVDQKIIYSWKYDRFNFNDTREVNAHTDFLTELRDRLTVERMHRLPGNHLNFYADTMQYGYTYFGEDASHDIIITVHDFAGNQSQIYFQVVSYQSLNDNAYQPKPADALRVTNEKGVAIHKSNLDVAIPEGAVYQDFYYDDYETEESGYLTPVYRVGDAYEALNAPITVGIKPKTKIADSLKTKAVIMRAADRYGLRSPCGGEWKGDFLSAKSNNFGNFGIMLDTIPPKVEKEYFPADQNSFMGGVVKLLMRDDISGIKSYTGKIDGVWFLFEYDKKQNKVVADVSNLTLNKEHTVELIVTDECGNVNDWKSEFYY